MQHDGGKGPDPGHVPKARTAVQICSLADALAAAAVAQRLGRPLTLVSAPGAALAAGPAWFAALVRQVRQRHPSADLRFILDCADSPGAVLAGLRLGLPALAIRPGAAPPALAALAAAAGAVLHDGPVAAHDLRCEDDMAAALARLLEV